MAGPFFLPADIKAGDFIEIGMLGAYGCAMRTTFNGLGADETHVVSDEPMVSLYTGEVEQERRSATVTMLSCQRQDSDKGKGRRRVATRSFPIRRRSSLQHPMQP